MSGLKHPSEKLGDIPPPVILTPPSRNTRSHFRRILIGVATSVLLLGAVRQWMVSTLTEDVIEQQEHRVLAHFLGHHRKGHKLLTGKQAEEVFLTVPNPVSAITASRQYATKPHLAGSLGDLDTAKDFLALLQTEFGIAPPRDEPIFSAGTSASRNATLHIPTLRKPTAWIDVYYPVMNTPLDRSLEILGDDGEAVWSANVEEIADDTDPEAGKYVEAVPTFHGLSRGGEVKGKLVYANYGRKEDYDALDAAGVNLNGTIVITRYGGIFRGLKVKGAQERGAAGVLIYSDLRDDGTVTVDNGYAPYPDGPARNPTSVQRGSVQFLSIYPGDPTTPGYPAYENSIRTEGSNIPLIPSLPISAANAKVLLDEIAEGGKNRTISLVNHVDTRVIPIWNTMAVIPGHIKDEVVIVGNHRDAWVMGGCDPSSGTASVNEVIKGLGTLLRLGWKPLRTIVIASWDAEEYGLIGSTEWGEDFEEWIDEHVVAYINLDSSTSGSSLRAQASPSLAHLVRSTAEEIPHPTKPGLTLWDATKDKGVLTGPHIDPEVQEMHDAEMQAADSLGISPLGSGSDFTVFLQRIGIASAQSGFSSSLSDPVYHYHSVYDTQRWQELYADPGFLRHVAVAKHLGLQTLRVADSVILPLNTTHYALELNEYLKKVENIAATTSLEVDLSPLRKSIHSLHTASVRLDKEKFRAERHLKHLLKKEAIRRLLKLKARNALCKLKKIFGKECGCPHKRQTPTIVSHSGNTIKPRVGRFPAWVREQNEQRREQEHPSFSHKRLLEAVKRVQAANKKLVQFEKGFIHADGIKDREWYRHLGVAPGKWLGYGATTLPALTEAFTIEHNVTLAKYEAERLTQAIDKLAETIQPSRHHSCA